jgi:hypothetical protein
MSKIATATSVATQEQTIQQVLIHYGETNLRLSNHASARSNNNGALPCRLKRAEIRNDVNTLLRSLQLPTLTQKHPLWAWFCVTYIAQTAVDEILLDRLDSQHYTVTSPLLM